MIKLKRDRSEQTFDRLDCGDINCHFWGAVASAAIPAIAGLLKGSPEEPSVEQRTTQEQQSQIPTLPEWALPYVAGQQIREWPTQQVNPEYMEYMQQMGQGQFAGQSPVNSILGFDELTNPQGGQMANLLGIGSQYSQVAPQMLDQDAMAAAQAAQRAPSLMTEPGPRSPAEMYRDRQGAGHWAADWSGGQFGEAWRRGPSKQQRSLDAIEMSDWYRQQQEKNR